MTISIQNEHVKATFAVKGAELQSLMSIHSGTQYLWSGDSSFWGKFSPVLFPIVGALKDNRYSYDRKEYQLPRHGFARDMDFEYEMIGENEVLFGLTHSEETLGVYPFEFNLKLRYKIIGASLCCTYEVYNPAEKDLLFSIGGHPAFAVPVNGQGDYSDYYLQFNHNSEINCNVLVDGLISDEIKTIQLIDKKLPLTHELFYNDALVIKYLQSDSISLMNSKDYTGINFKFSGFPFFGIWAAKNADFVCLEPWCGIADGVNHNQKLVDKEGIEKLQAGQSWERTWQVTCF
jgi:galactose mutarotase-like enzyme